MARSHSEPVADLEPVVPAAPVARDDFDPLDYGAAPGASEETRAALQYLEIQADMGEQIALDFQDGGHAALMRSLAPREGLESLAATQAVRFHESAMRALARAETTIEGLSPRERLEERKERRRAAEVAIRLVNAAQKAASILARLQGRGARQRIEVKHVSVADGGQVAIGCNTGGDDA